MQTLARETHSQRPTHGVREFSFTRRDFQRVCAMIRQRAGIALAPGKEDLVYSRLARRLRQRNIDSFSGYLDWLESAGTEDEWQEFTNALTTNLTAFFREAHHFDTLKALLKRQPRGKHSAIWCSAASTGEEPYSIAITACEAYGTLTPPVSIIATDIDTNVLADAERGVYPLDRVAKMEGELVKRYFQRGTGSNDGWCRVNPALKSLITYRPLNLLDDCWPVRGPFTAIFCRNVMIYFDKPTQYRLIRRFAPMLARDGLLFTGHSESFFNIGDALKACGRTVFCRADGVAVAA
ncbi:MAG TPA: CheR family methyltransferase [Solimonas sp.]|nr:CheR family methyltransferase [Solimonas sp.]